MNILWIQPGKPPVNITISGTLSSMQELVGGTIQAIYPFDDPVALVCNDEGKLLKLPMCRFIAEISDIICGSFFLCGAPLDMDSFTSLTEEQLQRYQARFQVPELFLLLEGNVLVVPTLQEGDISDGNRDNLHDAAE